MEQIVQFFSHPFFTIVGGVTVVIAVINLLLLIVFYFLGIAPILWRLGLGRWLRKIAIVANTEMYSSLKKDLVDSGIFRTKNISPISSQALSEVKDSDLLLVHYQSFTEDEIKTILANKKSKAGMVFYFPEFAPEEGRMISKEILKQINTRENTTVVNFRGRLLNDVITTLITTSYEKR
ncbi:MAG: hypothetical protein ABIJ72_00115 [bacterium]